MGRSDGMKQCPDNYLIQRLKTAGTAEVDSVAEAVRLADLLKQEGQFDLFRGQTNADWPLLPSGLRCGEEERKRESERFQRFLQWAEGRHGMRKYLQDRDAMWAIAQHYGFRTFFLDLTDSPRVAGFFACHTQYPVPVGQMAALYCLNSKDFTSYWQSGPGKALIEIHGSIALPEIVRIDVADLWRLQAQRGCFLWTPIVGVPVPWGFGPGLERFYTVPKITFPHVSDHPLLPQPNDIYPDNQSKLEEMLGGFFAQLREEEVTDEFLNKGVAVHMAPEPYEVTSWHPPGVPISQDWEQGDDWLNHQPERFADVLPGAIDEIATDSVEGLIACLQEKFTRRFVAENRRLALEIGVSGDPQTQAWLETYLKALRRQWNGMRRLPYTDTEMHQSLQATLALLAQRQVEGRWFRPYGNDRLHVDLSVSQNGNGEYSRAYMSRARFLSALNPAFLCAINEYKGETRGVFSFLPLDLTARPWERFTFTGLRDLFVYELIPSQVIWRSEINGIEGARTVVYFNPSEIKVLGPV